MGWSESLGQVMQTRPVLAYGASYLGGVIATDRSWAGAWSTDLNNTCIPKTVMNKAALNMAVPLKCLIPFFLSYHYFGENKKEGLTK